MRQLVAGKDLNMEAEESTVLGAILKLPLVKTQQTEKTARAIVYCKVCELVKRL
jgi:hypothetical protein